MGCMVTVVTEGAILDSAAEDTIDAIPDSEDIEVITNGF